MNLGVSALLGWVKATIPPDGEETDINIEDLQNGEILLQLVCLLKKVSIPCQSNCVDDRFKIISDFVERDCRFNALNGTPIIWKAIRDGSNATTEIAKVLLVLVYHDMMNDHCTLRTLDCNVEGQIASLTATYVTESEGSVSLRPGLDAYLSRRYLSVPCDIFDKSCTSSVSTVSSVYDEDESPLFARSQKVQFLDLQNVASPSASCSPIQDIMNTPIFQMRKMQRQLIQDRDYRDGLEKELSNKLTLLAQRESQIIQLQHCLDKFKEDRGTGEQIATKQIDELENKNNMLQSRFNDVLKQNKELKGNSSLMERKVDELSEENGVLSSRVRTVCSQLAFFEAEVGRLTETQTSNEVEWRSTLSNLQSELNEERAQKELLTEQIEILHGKISCLEDKISRSAQEEEGDNMWISVEKELLDDKICLLTDKLENTTNSLHKIEVEVQAKTKELKNREEEISGQKTLLIQQQNQMDQLIESKNEAVENLQNEMTNVREVLQMEICTLKLRLEEAEKQKHQQTTRLHAQVASCTQKIEKLKEIKQQKEDLLLQTEERVNKLMTELYTANNLLADKVQEVTGLTEKVVLLTEMHQQSKDERLAKEEMFSRLLLEKSQDEAVLQNNIQLLKDQVNDLKSSLKQAEEELQVGKELLTKTCQENGERIEGFNHDIELCKETIETLKEEIHVKDEQIIEVKNDHKIQSEQLNQEIAALKSQTRELCESLSEAKQQVQTWQTELMKLKEESSHQKGLLQQALSSSEEMVNNLKAEIKTKIEQIDILENQSLEQLALLKKESSDLQQQVESLKSQLTKAEEDLDLKENDFALKQQQVEGLRTKVSQFEDEIKSLHANIQTKEEELLHLKKETSTEMEHIKEENLKRSQELEKQIQHLNLQVQNLQESLNSSAEQLSLKEDTLARKEMEISNEKQAIQKLKTIFDGEIIALRQQLHANEEQKVAIKNDADHQSNLQQKEMQSLKDQLDNMVKALSKAEETVQTKLQMISEQEMESAQEEKSLQQKVLNSQVIINKLESEICVKEQQMQQCVESFKGQLEECSQKLVAKEEMFSRLLLEKSQDEEVLQNNIQSLKDQVNDLKSSLKQAEEELQVGKKLLTKTCQENGERIEGFNHDIELCKETIETLKEEIQVKDEQIIEVKNDHKIQSEQLNQEIAALKSQTRELCESLSEAKQQVQTWQTELMKLKEESSHQKGLLQQALSSSEEMVNNLKAEIKTKIEQIDILENQSLEQLALLKKESSDLQQQVESLKSQLTKAEEDLDLKENDFALKQQQVEGLRTKVSQFEDEIKSLHANIQTKEEELLHLKKETSTEMEHVKEENLKRSQELEKQIQHLNLQVQNLQESLNSSAEQLSLKEDTLARKEMEISNEKQAIQKLKTTFDGEIIALRQQLHANEEQKVAIKNDADHQSNLQQKEMQSLKDQLDNMVKALSKAEETVQTKLQMISEQEMESAQEEKSLQQKVLNSQVIINKLESEICVKEQQMQQCVESFKGQLEECSQKLVAKEEQLLKLQLGSAQQIDHLKQELVSLNVELKQHREMNTHVLRQKEETLESTQKERDTLIKEKETLNARILDAEKELEVMVYENQRLSQAKQAIESENDSAVKLQTKLQQELQMLKQDKDSLLIEKEKMEDIEVVKKDLLEQLSAKSTAVEHYKAQIEKAVDHYNSKKQLLQKSEEEVANLKHSLEVQEREVKTVAMENNLLQMELDKIQNNEKLLLNKVASLEAQLSFADQTLRAQSKFQNDSKASEPSNLKVPGQKCGINTRTKLRSMSSDSLDQSSLDDSLNNTRKLSAPGESSTPLVRSSERLAAKRHVPLAESLETLYFTPINTRHRTTTDSKPEDSAKRDSAWSINRRRTTQKTPGRNEADETFYSLSSARSHPNLSRAQGISTELFTTPKVADADQLIGLPGYRRSTIHSQATSTFCVGAENEPEGGPEDWLRIAEIQARNKACLPHLKSSYPVEFDTVRNSALMYTDEELRTGDPIETIRRASVMPGQLQDSLTSHRLSYMGLSGNTATSRSRLSLMPGQAIPQAAISTLGSSKSSKRAPSTLTVHPTSPEKKMRASCFPRPLTPKNKNGSGPAIPRIQTTLSPADRRQSMMFTIDNTPKKDPRKDILKKGLSKLRSSTRKSPGKKFKSPAQSASRRGQENIPARNSRTAVGGAGRLGSQKSPLVANKGQRKSPQVSTRTAKSPGLTTSARKECVPVNKDNLEMMSRMKM
ncbi:nuclear mitotic apparatus protein 1 isoform X2 [Eucyclogobius newberryi]|uniref:nuclear mitotic apparatus protein 1 isoform X2 n=1 Tax=Eucyclogobius newberryi TaxID=166745 RepID=UPI003B5C71F8